MGKGHPPPFPAALPIHFTPPVSGNPVFTKQFVRILTNPTLRIYAECGDGSDPRIRYRIAAGFRAGIPGPLPAFGVAPIPRSIERQISLREG